jgi:CheY-like chemotaxis protein
MKMLIAEDDQVSRTVLERALQGWGHEVVAVSDGNDAWNLLQQDDAPKLAILDWMMPGLDGVEVCRRVRGLERSEPTYIILLTAKHQKDDVVAGLNNGANDYVTKPFERRELQARVQVGERMTALQHELAERIRELEAAMAQVKQLQGLLPICSYCKAVRDDENYWQHVDAYIEAHSEAKFSHGICPDCFRNVVMPEMTALGIDCDDILASMPNKKAADRPKTDVPRTPPDPRSIKEVHGDQ